MNRLSGHNASGNTPVTIDKHDNVYLDYLLDKVPDFIKNAPPARLLATIDQTPAIPDWYAAASVIDRQYLKELINERWRLQDALDKTVGDLHKDINAFCEPLLVQALKEQLNLELDVNETLVRLYIPATLGFGIDTNASRLRQSTLLEAALHNFEAPETQVGAFRDGSGIFTQDAQGEIKRHALTVEQFASMCRRLDLGKQYQRYIKERLDPAGADDSKVLERQSMASERASFSESALIAYLKNDISPYAYGKLQQVRDSEKNITIKNRPLQCHRLSLMGFNLTGIVLFSAVADPSQVKEIYDALVPDDQRTIMAWSQNLAALPGQEFDQFKLIKAFFANGPVGMVDEIFRRDDIQKQSRLDGPLIAYVPDDPDHPLKEYDSFSDFMKQLTRQLRSTDYQQFFSRFVAQQDKGRFVAKVKERFTTFTWRQREPLDMGPWWRETAVENPKAEPITNVIAGSLWARQCRWRREKTLADARHIAVPTGDEDATTRWNRLTSYLDIGWNVFNFGAMLVPGLGEAMLGIMVGQMVFETMEGLEDWSKGDKDEASAHLTGVLINFAQLAIMAAGHAIPGGAAASIKPSPFVDQMKQVELPNGKTRLWHPDLRPYEHKVALPKGSTPNEWGLHQHNGQDFLPLDGKHFQVKNDPQTGQPRLRHPGRAGAYQPKLKHNGAGAWLTELDRPIEWDKTLLMKRLGHTVDGFDEITLEQIRMTSGVDEDLLRRLQVEHEPPPALLLDTIQRFRAWADAGKLSAQILANEVPDELVDFLPPLLTELPRWPEHKGIEVFQGPELWGRSMTYGALEPSAADAIKLTRAEVRAGKLPGLVLKSLDETEIRELLGQGIASDEPARVEALQGRLAMLAQKQQKRLFAALYKGRQRAGNPQVLQLQETFKQLPTGVVEELLAHASAADLLKLTEKKTIALTLKEHARAVELEVRLNLAFEKLFRGELDDPDTEKLLSCLRQILPDLERASLAPGVGQGATLVRALQRAPAVRDRLRPLLAESPVRKPAYDPATMRLRGGMQGYPQLLPDWDLLHRRASSLYRALSEEQVDELLGGFGHQASVRLDELEAEFDELNRSFRLWVDSPTERFRFSPDGIREVDSRNKVYKAIRECWQRTGPRGLEVADSVHTQALDLDDLPIGQHLGGMPQLKANFDHVTSLNLRNAGLGTFQMHFLRSFPRLRALDLTGNQLRSFPQAINEMKFLRSLELRDNPIELTPEGAARLRTMSRLEFLGLSNNPLRLAPDISRMRGLVLVLLDNTEIDRWPTGLFTQSRPRNFVLDLRNNALRQIPDIAPGSYRAELLARTLLSRERLSEGVQRKLEQYIESVGLDPERPYPPRSTLDRSSWGEGVSGVQWQGLLETWNAVEDEFGSTPFFNEIRQLTTSHHFKFDKAFKADMTSKLWRMLEAMAKNSELREKLFTMARATTDCVDGGAQLFNSMGVEVLIHEAYELASPSLVEAQLVTLAKGKSRLDQLTRIAHQRVVDRLAAGEQFRRVDADGDVTGSIDEVEVHLAYMTDLAERLDLPWQSRDLQFRNMTGVTQKMIDDAWLYVLKLEEGDLLRDSISEQPFWASYLQGVNRRAFNGFRRRMDATTEFYLALDKRATETSPPAAEKDRLKEEIRVLAAELGKPESEMVPGYVMTDEQYGIELNLIDEEMKALLKTLTQQAMDRAKLQSVETPFTVEQSN